MTIRLDDLDYFLAVAEAGQVRRAALKLDVSQPAITKGVQRLERELGFPLFERSARGMTLTPVARQFHARTRALRASLGEAIKEASDLHLGARGVLRVGVSPLYAARLFAPACLQLLSQRPAAHVKVVINLNDALIAALRQGDLDLSLNALPATMPDDLQATPLLRDELHVVARRGHPLLARRRLQLADLAAAHWILPGPGVAARQSIEGRFAERGLPPPHVAVEVSTTASQLSAMLLQSDLLSLMGESMLNSPYGKGLAALQFPGARFVRSIGAVTRRDAHLPPLARRFLEILEQQRKAREYAPSKPAL